MKALGVSHCSRTRVTGTLRTEDEGEQHAVGNGARGAVPLREVGLRIGGHFFRQRKKSDSSEVPFHQKAFPVSDEHLEDPADDDYCTKPTQALAFSMENCA